MRAPFMADPALLALQPIEAVPGDTVEALLDRAFGTDRHARTAYKVRGAARAIPALSLVATDGGTLIGSIQCWPIRFTPDLGAPTPLVMVGPVAVEPARQRDGIGRRLMQEALAAAARQGTDDRLVLIGDPEYYGRFFGFTAARTGRWRLPGPVDRHRLLARGEAVPDMAGELGPA